VENGDPVIKTGRQHPESIRDGRMVSLEAPSISRSPTP